MTLLRRLASWVGAIVMLASVVILTLIGTRYLVDPVRAAAELQTSFASPAGVTSMRIGFGAFPLALAAILAACLLAPRRRLAGLAIVATVMGLAALARVVGIAIDGPAAESIRLLRPEVAMLALSSGCAAVEWRARRDRAVPLAPRSEGIHVSR
ncbi:MAG TPA: DUF4345 family protein [Candidatus Eisenbacteria bacterium]